MQDLRQWKRKVSMKSLNFTDTPQVFSACKHEDYSSNEKFQTFEKKRKKKTILSQMFGQDRLQKNSQAGRCFSMKRRHPESSIDIDRQNKRLRHDL